MPKHDLNPHGAAIRRRALSSRMAVGCAILALGAAGCENDARLEAFRDAAAPTLQAGFVSLATALIDGSFAAATTTQDAGDRTSGAEDAAATARETASADISNVQGLGF